MKRVLGRMGAAEAWRFLAINIFILICLGLPAVEAAPVDDWSRGNEAYIAGDYPGAIAAYKTLVDEGLVSYKLLYNLGNAYFKNGQLGRAILMYNRALALNPGDRDTRWNLEIAESRVKVKIDPVPQFFVTRWVNELRGTMSADRWALTALGLLATVAGSVLLYLLAESRFIRKTGFYAAVVGAVLFIVTFSFSTVKPPSQAIVMSEAVTVKTAPDAAARDAFILYEGAKVHVAGVLGEWSEVEVADGNRGWVASSTIESVL